MTDSTAPQHRTEREDFQATRDPALMEGADRGEVNLLSYGQLYQLWERQQWQTQAIDFSQDREDWWGFPEEERLQRMYGLRPFFVEGFNNAARDEHRHVAFGARFLREMAQKDGRYRDAIQRTLVECGPVADGVLAPPWYEEGQEIFGVSLDETRAFALKALERRLKVIGLTPVT